MPIVLLCDEHIPFPVIAGLNRQGIDVISVQGIGLGATPDPMIIDAAQQLGRVIYTGDADFLRLNDAGIQHAGIFYHHPRKYSIGEAVSAVALACQLLSMGEMLNRVEFL